MTKCVEGPVVWNWLVAANFGSSAGAHHQSVLLADTDERWRERVMSHLPPRSDRVFACRTSRELRELASRNRPELTVLDLRLDDGPTLGTIAWLKENRLSRRIVVATNHDSVATAVRCAQLGVEGYYIKDSLLAWSAPRRPASTESAARPMPLARAVWEHLHRAVEQAGSITAAADQLGLDRRSLRRMLGKYAPPT